MERSEATDGLIDAIVQAVRADRRRNINRGGGRFREKILFAFSAV